MKKLVSILLALVMLLSLVPVAWAEEPATPTSTPEYVAKIGEQGYATLAEAVDAVTENGTITLLKDVSDTGEITLPAGRKRAL